MLQYLLHNFVQSCCQACCAVLVQATAAAQINASVLTAGDYTVYITGVAQEVSNAELVEFASHYGEVQHCHSAHIIQTARRSAYMDNLCVSQQGQG